MTEKEKLLNNLLSARTKFGKAKQDPPNIYFSRLLNDLKDLRRLYYE